MSLFHLSSYPTELQYFLLDRMDEKSLVTLKHIDRESRNSFESNEIVHYLLACRLQRLIQLARPFAWRSTEHYAIVRRFFLVVSILPTDIKFPKPYEYDKSSELKTLIGRLTEVISTGDIQFSDPLNESTFRLSNLQDDRMAAFMTCLPTRLLDSTKRAWAELSRRFALYGHLNEEAFFTSFSVGIQTITTNGGRDFIQGVSKDLLKAILNRYLSHMSINDHLIWGFSKIENPDEAHEKMIVLGDWFKNYAAYSLANAENRDAHTLEKYNRARTLMNILYMATFADKKKPLDRTLVQSWIPKEFMQGWENFDKLTRKYPGIYEINSAVEECFGELFNL